jgi:hypothetical protein
VLWEALIEALQFSTGDSRNSSLSREDTACSLNKLSPVIGGMLNFLMKVAIADAIEVSTVDDVHVINVDDCSKKEDP